MGASYMMSVILLQKECSDYMILNGEMKTRQRRRISNVAYIFLRNMRPKNLIQFFFRLFLNNMMEYKIRFNSTHEKI